MKATEKSVIESFAWDCTVGSGRAEEFADLGHEPGKDKLTALARRLGRPLTVADEDAFQAAWRACLQAAAQP